MGLYWIRCLSFLSCFICCHAYGYSNNTFTVSSFSYRNAKLRPYDLRYIRVDLPQWFASMSVQLESDVALDKDSENTGLVSNGMLPVFCFRRGSPPLPDISNSSLNTTVFSMPSNESIRRIQQPQIAQLCYRMQRNITMQLTNEQISPGIWYIGLFNGLGPTRTQSKMIIRGTAYSFNANVTVEGCIVSTTWGLYCNQTIDPLPCAQPETYNSSIKTLDFKYAKAQSVLLCKNSLDASCISTDQVKVYYIDILEVADDLTIMATDVRVSSAPSNYSGNFSGANLICYARHGSIASSTQHDYSSNISTTPLVIRSPVAGRWYLTVLPGTSITPSGETRFSNTTVCFSLNLQVLECPLGKVGLNCLWNRYKLQIIPRISAPFESYYLPLSGNVSASSANFHLAPLFSNFSSGGLNDSWTYFDLEIPPGAAGGNIHVRVTSDEKIDIEIYTRFGGLPSLQSWDYYYVNEANSSDGSTFFMSNNSTEEKTDFYILNAREGIWVFGLRRIDSIVGALKGEPTMSLSLERCPRRCSSHGECKTALDASGLTSYSFCSCDRNHGGFDCSIEIVSYQGHVLQSIFLVASNAAAILPAFWALRQKAFAEWVLFTSSGISSGLYHACDVGTWCALSFGVLQFMDFWLSFMAVISTFLYLATINEVHKRAIHTAVAILTALMAITKATRSSNIILVMAIGVMGLLIGWLIELSSKWRTISFSTGVWLHMLDRWQVIRVWMQNLVKTLVRMFRWGFLGAGFLALAMAGISWKLETSESYWIWHSLWHVTIYTSSFFFLCSKATVAADDGNEQRPDDVNYALTRQNSFSGGR